MQARPELLHAEGADFVMVRRSRAYRPYSQSPPGFRYPKEQLRLTRGTGVKTARILWVLAFGLVLLPMLAQAQGNLFGDRLTTSNLGEQLSAGGEAPALSASGRYIAFASTSNNIGQPSNGTLNIYRYDLLCDQYLLGVQTLGTGNSTAPSISANGLAIAFDSIANDLVENVPAGSRDVFYSRAYDLNPSMQAFETYQVSRGLGGAAANDASQYASISSDGRFVAFQSFASNLISGDTNSSPDIFVADASNLFANPPERVSVGAGGAQINGPSRALSPRSISHDGRFVVFSVDEPVSIDGSNAGTTENVFVRDRTAGTTRLISKSTAGVAGGSSSDEAAISPNGRYVVFRSFSTNLVASPSGSRIYVRDRQTNTTTNMPLPADATTCEDPRISDAGDIIAQCNMNFPSSAQAFLYKPAGSGAFYRLSSSVTDTNGNGSSGNYSDVSSNGNVTTFDSAASDLVPNDTNSSLDVFYFIPEPDAASALLAAIAALAVTARRRRAISSRISACRARVIR